MNAIIRKYRMSNANLSMLAVNINAFMIRDAALFAGRGVTANDITAFESLSDVFKYIKPDSYYQAARFGIAESKRIARSNAHAQLSFVSGFVEQMWGKDSSEYKLLRIKGAINMTDNDFLVACLNVVTTTLDYLPTLSAIGLTQSDINSLSLAACEFESDMNEMAQNYALRKQYALQRTQLGNELYSFMKLYCSVGQLIWYNVDAARYDNYIIYKNSHKSRPDDAEIPSAERALN